MTTKRFVKYDGNYDSSRTFGMTLADGSENTIQTTIVPDSGDNSTSVIKRSRFILSKKDTSDVNAGNTVFTFDIPYTLTAGKLYKFTVNCSMFIHTTGTTVYSGIYEWQQVIHDTNPSSSALGLIDDLVVTEKSATSNLANLYIGPSSFTTSINTSNSISKYRVVIATMDTLDLTSGSYNALLDVELVELTPST